MTIKISRITIKCDMTIFKYNNSNLSIQTGVIANQATSSILLKYGETVVLTALVVGKEKDVDYLPLQVVYEERFYASGKIKDSLFNKREGKPSDEAVLTGRMIDRSLRSLIQATIRNEMQVVVTVLSVDKVNKPDILAVSGASLALMRANLKKPYIIGGKIENLQMYIINTKGGFIQQIITGFRPETNDETETNQNDESTHNNFVAMVKSKYNLDSLSVFIDQKSKLLIGTVSGDFGENKISENISPVCDNLELKDLNLNNKNVAIELLVKYNYLENQENTQNSNNIRCQFKEQISDYLNNTVKHFNLNNVETPLFNGPVAAVRIGMDVENNFIINPNYSEIEISPLDLIVSGNTGSICMIEAGANLVPEETILKGIEIARCEIDKLIEIQNLFIYESKEFDNSIEKD